MKQFAEGFGIGAALIVALGAVSLLFKPGLLGLGLGQPRFGPRARSATGPRAADTRPAPLPPDFLDLCRAAGL